MQKSNAMKRFILAILVIVFLSCSKDNLNGQSNNGILPEPETPITPPETPPVNPPQTTSDVSIPSGLLYYYQSVDFSKNGQELYNDLAQLTIAKHTNILGYEQRHPYLRKADASLSNKNKVLLIYSGQEVTIGSNIYDTEHVYPKSFLEAKTKTTSVADLHHLRYCVSKDNSTRGNRAFTSGNGEKGVVGNFWYPGDDWKGDVARIILYMNLRYNEAFHKVSTTTQGVNLFLQWNVEDPVSAFENQRNNEIEKAQGNRNPFIDNPYLATKIWGGTMAQNLWK